MAGTTAVSSNVGAGVSQVRFQDHARTAQMKDQVQPSGDVRSAALELIRSAMLLPGTTGRDLDVLA
ncbi:MAG TPA: hypothetical protein PLI09_18985 [Candidatus Hydrogenedentes bacterium]|nr:hypothetical protein [Candidatus Hydrogenedentota bacterium]